MSHQSAIGILQLVRGVNPRYWIRWKIITTKAAADLVGQDKRDSAIYFSKDDGQVFILQTNIDNWLALENYDPELQTDSPILQLRNTVARHRAASILNRTAKGHSSW